MPSLARPDIAFFRTVWGWWTKKTIGRKKHEQSGRLSARDGAKVRPITVQQRVRTGRFIPPPPPPFSPHKPPKRRTIRDHDAVKPAGPRLLNAAILQFAVATIS